MDEKKYKQITEILVGGAFFSLVVLFIGGAFYNSYKIRLAEIELEKAKSQRGYVFKKKDLNDNGSPEKFYEINGEKYFLEIDGENLEAKLGGN